MTATIVPMRRTPAPPRHLMDAMSEAGRDGDDLRLAALQGEYITWLWDVHGIPAPGSHVPDRVWNPKDDA